MFLIFINSYFMKMSKKFWALVPLALLVFSACSSAAPESKPAEVKAFVSKEGNFSINFPGEPEVSSDKIDGGEGGFDATMTSYSYSPDDSYAFLVAYTDINVGKFSKEEARNILKDEQVGALESVGVKEPEEEKEMDYDANSAGLRYKAKGSDGTHLVAQTYFIGNRMYQIEMLKVGGYHTDEEIKNFIGTFKVLK